MNLFTLYLVAFIYLASSEKFNYDGYKVYQVTPKTLNEAKLLNQFEYDANFDFWTDIRALDVPVDIMVTPNGQNEFEAILKKEGIEHAVLISNVREIVEKEDTRRRVSPRLGRGEVTFTEYMRHGEILAYLDRLVEDYPEIVSTEVIGKSFEGRNLTTLKISSGGSGDKPIIFIQATIHGREWIAPPVALYIIQQLVENSTNAFMYRDINWIIHPIVNPDGYEYTFTNQRFWRKTRTPGTICDGVDGNRNFDYQWMLIASSWQCIESYAGYAPFSELETQAVRKVLLENKGKIKLFIDLHSYGQMILYPWAFTNDRPANIDELHPLGLRVNASIGSVRSTSYHVGTTHEILYASSGGGRDYAAGVGDVNLAFTVELPRGGSIGYNPDTSEIKPVVEETWEGIKTFYEHVQENYIN